MYQEGRINNHKKEKEKKERSLLKLLALNSKLYLANSVICILHPCINVYYGGNIYIPEAVFRSNAPIAYKFSPSYGPKLSVGGF